MERVLVLPQGKLVEVTPGVRYAAAPLELAPRFAVVRLVPAGDGTYRPTLEVHDHWVRLTVAEKMLGLDVQSLYRLVDGGFVSGRQPTPNTRQISLDSFFKHCQAVEADPDFWHKKDNKKRFAQALSRSS